MLNLLKSSGIGFWDQENRRFVMTADFTAEAVISRLFHACAQVYIDEGRPEPAVTRVIWETPWENAAASPPPAAGPDLTVTEDGPESKPEAKAAVPNRFFDDSRQAKLKTELDSRKYSRETKKAYMRFNRELCAFCQRTPLETGPGGIKRFPADRCWNRTERCAHAAAGKGLSIASPLDTLDDPENP